MPELYPFFVHRQFYGHKQLDEWRSFSRIRKQIQDQDFWDLWLPKERQKCHGTSNMAAAKVGTLPIQCRYLEYLEQQRYVAKNRSEDSVLNINGRPIRYGFRE